MTNTNANAVLAATGLNRGTGENPVTEEQALETVKFLLELGVDLYFAKTLTKGPQPAASGASVDLGWSYRRSFGHRPR